MQAPQLVCFLTLAMGRPVEKCMTGKGHDTTAGMPMESVGWILSMDVQPQLTLGEAACAEPVDGSRARPGQGAFGRAPWPVLGKGVASGGKRGGGNGDLI